VRRGIWLLGFLLSGFSMWTAARAVEAPDDGLLEFLGSVDTEDKEWRDYLARTDIDKVARRAAAGGADAPPAANPPSAPHPVPADPPANPPPANSGKPVVSP
jgi:hypothetical protein